jgi:prepilin-type N-terminal cleavage/methylation domain-containing protein
MKLELSSLPDSLALGRSSHPAFFLFNAIFFPSRFLGGSKARKSPVPSASWDFRASRSKGGFTLVELTVAIAVILVLVGAASLGVKPYYAYRDGRAAGEMLRAVKAAQLMYLSDNPSTAVANLTSALLLPYMPNGTWPTLPTTSTGVPTVNCTVFPPVAVLSGTTYDPSGSPTDGLWDVGLY